ncbi:MAG: metallophosphoesterase, partial [Verrucomicrobiota bacterium]
GDFIDRDFKSFSVVGPIYRRLKAPGYHVLGNHDFSVADEKKPLVPETLGLTNRYYAIDAPGWRFLVLDGNDLSFHGWPKDSPEHRQSVAYYKERGIKSPRWNGGIGSGQMAWIRKNLETAGERKIGLFCHFPIYPPNVHNLWNAGELVALLEEHACVKLYMNGHNHVGHHATKNGIHYLTLKGMVDTEESAYATIDVFDARLEVKGYGREEDRTLTLR